MSALGQSRLTRGLHGKLGGHKLARMGIGDKGGGVSRGSELVTVPIDATWTASGTGATVDATGAHFLSAAALATVFHSAVTENDTTYEVTIVVANYVSGGVRAFVSGATSAHGASGAARTANGTFTEQITTSGAGANNLRIALLTTVASTSLDVTSISVKKVLSN
jgi:hypothetical protein